MIDIKQLYNICNELIQTSSTLGKKAILERESNNEGFKVFLKFLFDPNIVTGISDSKISKELESQPKPTIVKRSFLIKTETPSTLVLSSLEELFEYLKINNTGRDSDIRVCQEFIRSNCDTFELRTFVSQVVTKSLKLGMNHKIIRNVYGKDFIDIFEVQNGKSLDDVKLNPNEWFCLSQKMNGNRALYYDGEILSRQGKQFYGIDHIISDLDELQTMFDVPMVFDGEIIRRNIDNLSDNENFTIGTGILNSDAPEKPELMFVLFDLLPLDEFDEGESTATYKERLSVMRNIPYFIKDLDLHNIELVDFLYDGTDTNMIQYWLNVMDSEDKEGCMLARDVTYKCKRHNGLLKVKTFHTADLRITGFEEGKGKNKGTLGSVIVNYNGNEVGVGGFSDYLRDEIWNNKDKYLGRLIEVKYKTESTNHSTEAISLQFPTFVRFRDDKSEESDS